jgi:exodeoxyribonuclease V alpha subunit
VDADPNDPNDSGDPLSGGLRAAFFAHDVGDETLWAAWEVSAWASGAPAAERRALCCLVVALLEAIEAGGTFLLLGGGGDAHAGVILLAGAPATPLDQSLRRLGLDDANRQSAGRLAARLLAGTAHPAIAGLVGAPGARRPFILFEGALYPERFWCLEERLVTLLRARLDSVPPPWPGSVDDAIRSVGGTESQLADEQVLAIRAALRNPLTIIAGGPGTGKTSTVVALLRVLNRLGVTGDQVAMAAPTGRAAQRMNESVSATLASISSLAAPDVELGAHVAPATTLHRLLGIRSGGTRPLEPDEPTFYADWPLPHRIVIVDEASMIDLALMTQLLAASSPNARLVLIGDVDQLPSVQVGAAFRELVGGAPQIALRLTRSHRMNPLHPGGAQVLRVAEAFNRLTPGARALELPAPRLRAGDLELAGFERLRSSELDHFLDRWYREILSAETNAPLALLRRYPLDRANHLTGDWDRRGVKTLLDTHRAARILCVTRVAGRASSAAAVNRFMHGRVRATALAFARAGDGEDAGEGIDVDDAFIPGEPVIVVRNDYQRGLFNGDVGVVLRVRGARRDEDELGVAFDKGHEVLVHPLNEIEADVGLAFALTVHKAQGSEFDRVALVLPEIDVPLLTREVVYTALTRARHGVVVVGDPALLTLAVSRTLDRTSGLAKKLRSPG